MKLMIFTPFCYCVKKHLVWGPETAHYVLENNQIILFVEDSWACSVVSSMHWKGKWISMTSVVSERRLILHWSIRQMHLKTKMQLLQPLICLCCFQTINKKHCFYTELCHSSLQLLICILKLIYFFCFFMEKLVSVPWFWLLKEHRKNILAWHESLVIDFLHWRLSQTERKGWTILLK